MRMRLSKMFCMIMYSSPWIASAGSSVRGELSHACLRIPPGRGAWAAARPARGPTAIGTDAAAAPASGTGVAKMPLEDPRVDASSAMMSRLLSDGS